MCVRLKLGALMIALLLVLTACGGANSGQTTRADQILRYYSHLTGFSAEALVTADYGDRIYQYTVSLTGDLDEGALEVLSPESIAGAGFSWSDGGGTISYDTVSLETGSLSSDGLSPTDAMPLILTALTSGRQISTGEQALSGEETIFLEMSVPSCSDGSNTVLVWLAEEDGALCRAEVTMEGVTVITYSFTSFTFTYETEETED